MSKPGSGKEKKGASWPAWENYRDIIFTFLITSASPTEEQSGQNQVSIHMKELKFYISVVTCNLKC